MMSANEQSSNWLPAISLDDLKRQRKAKIDTEAGEVLLLWHDDCPHAVANVCIHRDRELAKGAIFDGRIVCPGHQWAFDLESGYCKERDRTQPVHDTRVEDGVVLVNLAPRNTAGSVD